MYSMLRRGRADLGIIILLGVVEDAGFAAN
jgi:hypothetical protein